MRSGRHEAHSRDDDLERRSLGLTASLRSTPDATAGSPIPPSLYVGFAVASIGGPLALAAIYVPAAADMRSAGLLVVAGAALYALPLAVWIRYSEEIVSAGGLAAFVEAACGRRLALVQAAIWSLSYFLYLPYTVTDIVYEMLADVFPGLAPWRAPIEIVVPVAIVGLVLTGTRPVLALLLGSAALQLVLVLALGVVVLAKVGAPATSFTRVPAAHSLTSGSVNIALLFLCGSLPLFLGAEVAGGGRVVRRTLIAAFALVGAYLLVALFPVAAVDPALRQAHLPGFAIASAYAGRSFGIAVGVGGAASVAGLILAEYLALSRLLYSVTGVPIRRLLAWIGVPFVAVDALSLAGPESFDRNVLRPSLIALFASQLIVFVVFPIYRRRRGKLTVVDVLLAAGASALMAWGLYQAVVSTVST